MGINDNKGCNSNIQQQAHRYLQNLITDKPLYAIIDSAQDEVIIELLQHHSQQTRIQSLYEGGKGQQLASVAPYLAEINTADSALLKSLVEQGWGKHWAIYFTYPSEFKAARNQLRQCIRVGDSQKTYRTFRFYDDRVFRQYIPTFDMSQLIAFYGAIDSYWIEDENPNNLLQYQLRDLTLEIQPINLQQIKMDIIPC